MTKFFSRFRNLIRDEEGAATVEFVVVFPFFVVTFLSAFEVAAMNIRAVSMERATDIAVRDIRLNKGGNIPYGQVLNDICERSFMIPDCKQSVKIELVNVATIGQNLPPAEIDCVRRNAKIQPPARFTPGVENELMLIRVCAVIDPMFPTVGVGRTMPKDASGGYIVSASSAFVNEPQ